MKYRKSKGYMLLESIVHIFITSIVILELLTFYVDFYKGYVEIRNRSVFENNLRNFYINLDNMIKDYNVENIYVSEDKLYIIKNTDNGELTSVVNISDDKIVVKYLRNNKVLTITNMLYMVKELKIKQKENLIYLFIKESSGKEYTRCL